MIISFDPSFTRTGISIYSAKETNLTFPGLRQSGKFSFVSLSSECAKATFAHTASRTRLLKSQVRELLNYLTTFDDPIEYAVVEYAAVTESWAPGLFMLDYAICEVLLDLNIVVYLIGSNACNSFLGKRSVSKTEIVSMCKSKILWVGPRINHDEATAAVLLKSVENKLEFRKTTPKLYLLKPDCSIVEF